MNAPVAPTGARRRKTADTAGSTRRVRGRASGSRTAPPTAPADDHPLLNREIALLEFNDRVLAQAQDPTTPLLERLRFLCIVGSNLDEFFEIRVAGLKAQAELAPDTEGPDGLTPQQVLRAVGERAHALVETQYAIFNDELVPALAREGIGFLRRPSWTRAQAAWVRTYFDEQVAPVLTPIGLDPAHPFPRLLNKSLNFAVELCGKDAFGRNSGTAIVQAPRALPRFVMLPPEIAGCEYGFVFLSSILHAHVGDLFAGMEVKGCYQFRVTRNSDLFVDEEEIKNLRTALQGELPQRHFGDSVRLEVADLCPPHMSEFLLAQFGLAASDLYQVNGPVNLVRLMQVPDHVKRPDLKFKPFTPGVPGALAKRQDIFAAIRRQDLLLHHPFQSFRPVVSFIEQAATDPAVVAIKQTVYRTGADSELMRHLITAARNGKAVTVVVELLARFDEENNINWASRLEEVGAHVVYGVVGHKTHAKMAMVVRREDGRLVRYVHLGTGNYHSRTATLYTDFGLFSANPALAEDVNDVFTQLTGLGNAGDHQLVWQAPFTLHPKLLAAIAREADAARAGRTAGITAKMNSLLEPEIIYELYEASRAGVRIDLIVRGVCALRPGVPGLSDNIRVRSVIGRFLEHPRIFHFHSTGDVFLSSADWMDRNFFRRIELAFPVLEPRLRKRVIAEGLATYLDDNTQAWQMDDRGRYHRLAPGERPAHAAQLALLAELAARPGAVA